MRERVDRFVNVIPSKEHIQQLVEKLDLILIIETEGDSYYLSFKDGKVNVLDTFSPTGYTVTISGKIAHLEQLLDGDLKLMQGVRMNYLITACPYRIKLVLESLFYLTRPIPA